MKGAEFAAEIVALEYQALAGAVRAIWLDIVEDSKMTVYSETDKINALAVAMQMYRECAVEPITALAAYGVAVAIVSNMLRISLRQAASIVTEEVERLRLG